MRRNFDPSAPLDPSASLWVKICGVTRLEDAEKCAAVGASAVGFNFFRGSPRFIEPEKARAIVARIGDAVEWVGVFVDEDRSEIERTALEVGLDRVQLHGHETPEFLASLGASAFKAFKAVRIGDAADVEGARRFSGELLLVDAKVKGALGGTGESFDWSLLDALLRERLVVLAGGLRPDNVEEATRMVRPFGVDTASGVESSPGVKDPKKVEEFVQNARRARL